MKLIVSVLGKPDYQVTNPVFKNSAALRLFQVARVEAAEQQPEFQRHLSHRETRVAGQVKALVTKKEYTLEYAETLEISIPRMDLGVLTQKAIDNYNAHHYREWRDDNPFISIDQFKDWTEADDFRDRICVNHLRHRHSAYDDALYELSRKTGKAEAYLVLFQRVMERLAFVYPELSEECARQLQAKTGKTVRAVEALPTETGRCEFCGQPDRRLCEVPAAARMLKVCDACAPKCLVKLA